MKKRIILALCSLAIAVGGVGMSSLKHEERPVSAELLAETVEEEPEEIIEEVSEIKVCEKGCGLPTGHEGECVVSEVKEIEVVLKSTSMERDLKVKFVDKATGKVISGADFKMKVTSPSKSTKEYSDHDNDGIIWVKDIDGGKYTVAMVDLEGYVTAKTLSADVKKKIEYKVVEIEDEVKSESQVVVSQEDAEYGGADKDESTSGSAVLTDTVEFVASSVKEETKATKTQKKDAFGQPMYEKQKKDELGQPMYAKILSESDNYHTFKDGVCSRCGVQETVKHTHADTDNNCICDGTACNESMHATLENGICNKCNQVIKPEEHTHADTDNNFVCDSCQAELQHTHADNNNDCTCDIEGCSEKMHAEPANGVCGKCNNIIDETSHLHVDEDGNNECDIAACKKPISVSGTEGISDEDEDDGDDIEGQSGDTIVPILAFSYRPMNFLRTAPDKFIKYDEKSAPVYDTSSAKVYETETVKTYYGWQTIDGATYYFDKNGKKVTGQQVIQGISYTFSSDGVRSGTIGIDVSKYQTGINWTKVKNAGINFVMIRCGYRGYGSGVLVEDPMYRSHISGAKAAGLRVGVYFFSQAINEAEAVEEASMAVSLAKKYGINMPIAIDSEYANGGRGRADGLSKSARTAVTKAFCDTVKSAGYTPMVYASKSWFSDHLNVSALSSYRIWVAHYSDKCGYTGTYHIWQNTDKGKVDGVPGYVDMNISSI